MIPAPLYNVKISDLLPYRTVFLISFFSSLMLMGSAFFLGTVGIDDEILALEPYYDGVPRGLWATQIVTYLLPGQNGITFIPMFIGCMLYALAITLLIFLWNLKDRELTYFSAAVMGAFPYFASMMTFDVVQIAYPLGFIFIILAVLPIFSNSFNLRSFSLGVLFFVIAFALYQGVASMLMTVFISTAGVRFITETDKNKEFKIFWSRYFPRFVLVMVVGSIMYLISVKISKLVTTYQEVESSYSVIIKLQFLELSFYRTLSENVRYILSNSNDIPRLSSFIFLIAILPISFSIFKITNFSIPKKIIVFFVLLASVFLMPFWLMFIQENQMTPRSSVGIGFLYGFFYVALAYNSSKRLRLIANAVCIVWVFQFIFLGNEMYYTQHLMSKSEQININRILARIDAVAVDHSLPHPTAVVFLGMYSPGENKFARFNTLGSSAFSWGDGSIYRQINLFNIYGVDGLEFKKGDKLKNEISKFILDQKIPEWPNPSSVFLYQNKTVVVNFGRSPDLNSENPQSKKPVLREKNNKILFKSIVDKKLGAPNQDIFFSPENSIFLHPGDSPTEAEFAVEGKFEKVDFVSFIGLLPTEAFKDTLGGTVGVEFFMDGKFVSRQYVNRMTNQKISLDLSNAKKLKIIVDCANNNCDYDWLNIGVLE